ncbi:MAG: hypothetical protein JNK37_02605 [Verrucomicrobiales bacterium]|nr:hypothetical protein [Verrucomicrobiales bacterium]
MQPHRGTLILVLGILGIVLCPICGIIAWVMGNGDLKAIAAGQMDPTGEGLTKAGKICGIVATILMIVGVIIWVLLMVLGFGAAAMSEGMVPTPQ